ncbi:hypothetical protein ACLOJK_036572 [Asimina triloba]
MVLVDEVQNSMSKRPSAETTAEGAMVEGRRHRDGTRPATGPIRPTAPPLVEAHATTLNQASLFTVHIISDPDKHRFQRYYVNDP